MSFVTQDDVFAAMEPVITGVFEEFAKGKPVTKKLAADSIRRSLAQIRQRQAGSAQSDCHAGRLRAFPRLRLQGVRADAGRPQKPGLGDPRHRRRLARVLRPDEFMGARRGPARARLHHVARRRRGRRSPCQQYRPGANGGHSRCARPEGGRRGVLRRRRSREILEICRPCPDQTRRGAEPDRQGAVRTRLDRRLPDVRIQRGRQEDRLLAQPVLDAAGRPRCAQPGRTR